MLIPYLIQSLNDPKVCARCTREICTLMLFHCLAPRQVDYMLDVGEIRQLVHCRCDRRAQGAVLYSYYGGCT